MTSLWKGWCAYTWMTSSIFTKTLEEHCHVIHLVLEQLCQHQLYLKPKKYEIEQTWVEYLGLIILYRTAEMDLVKVAGVVKWLVPQNKK